MPFLLLQLALEASNFVGADTTHSPLCRASVKNWTHHALARRSGRTRSKCSGFRPASIHDTDRSLRNLVYMDVLSPNRLIAAMLEGA